MTLEELKEWIAGKNFFQIASENPEAADQLRQLVLPDENGFTAEQRELLGSYLLFVPVDRLPEAEEINFIFTPANPEVEGSTDEIVDRPIKIFPRQDETGDWYFRADLLTDAVSGKPLSHAGNFLRSLNFVKSSEIIFPAPPSLDD